MNAWLFVSSILTVILGIGHSVLGEWAGERRLVKRIQKVQLFELPEKDKRAKGVARLAWHSTSITWAAIGVAFFCLSYVGPNHHFVIIRILSVAFSAMGFLALLTAPRKGFLFFAIAATSWAGTI